MPAPLDEYFLRTADVRHAFDSAASTFDGAAGVHAEIRGRLLERLELVRLVPGVAVDLGAGTGHGSRALKDRYPRAQVIALDLSSQMLQQAQRQQRLLRRFHRVAGDAQRLPLKPGSVDLVLSNLMLQWCGDPDAVFSETRRVLKADGLFMFASLGPDSLRELRSAWAGIDGYTHVHRFIDMHDIGDALVRAGFAEPVMDTERLTVTYADLDKLLAELRGTASTNRAHGRRMGLLGRSAFGRFRQGYEATRRDGVLPVTLEIVHGHAWAGQKGSKLSANAGEIRVPVGRISRRQ